MIEKYVACLSEVGVTVRALVLDGHASNISAAKSLGYILSPENCKEYVTFNDEKMFFFLDYVHCIKLMRNIFASNILLDPDGNEISWHYIKLLQNIQQEEGLKLANKLSVRHIEFHNQKMKVNLAVQIFSRSVACALATLRQLGYEGFRNSESTEKFLYVINDLFDILNSRSSHARGYKAPLFANNFEKSFERLDECYSYISALCLLNGTPLISSKKKTGAIGLLICIRSLKGVYYNLKERASFFCTYRLCQDHLELFFNSIRRFVK